MTRNFGVLAPAFMVLAFVGYACTQGEVDRRPGHQWSGGLDQPGDSGLGRYGRHRGTTGVGNSVGTGNTAGSTSRGGTTGAGNTTGTAGRGGTTGTGRHRRHRGARRHHRHGQHRRQRRHHRHRQRRRRRPAPPAPPAARARARQASRPPRTATSRCPLRVVVGRVTRSPTPTRMERRSCRRCFLPAARPAC